MARPQKYDRNQALKSALTMFWSQGYTSTNLPQLLERTGLSRSSFYSAFGDKRELFKECFHTYVANIEPYLEQVRNADDPAQAIYHYFSRTLNPQLNQRSQMGCLVVNTLVEFEDNDEDLYLLAKTQIEKIDHAFLQCFKNAKAAGKLNTMLSAEALTNMFATLSCGIQVRRRSGWDSCDIKTVLDHFMIAIGLAPPASSLIN